MNCRECNLILDTQAPEGLTSAQRAAVDAHLASCEDCRADLANWRSVAALSIPPTAPELRSRIAALLPATAARSAAAARGRGRVFVVGGLLVGGVALAAMLALQLAGESQPAVDPVVSQSAPTAGEAQPVTESVTSSAEPEATARETSPTPGVNAEAGATFQGGLDPRSVVVLARPEAAAGAVERVEGAKCHDAIVEQLRAIVGLNVIAGPRVSSFDSAGLDDWQIARELGAGYLLVVSTQNGCNAYLHDARSSDARATIGGAMYGGATFPPANGWSGFASSVASSLRKNLLEDPATRIVEAQAAVLNSALSDGERVYALYGLQDRTRPIPGAFNSAVVAAAAQIGVSSPDASARALAWVNLRHVDDPYLIQPLLQSLATDIDEDVRMQAALTLNTFLDEPGVREALLRAAAEDSSREPSVTCCIPTVREAAEWASVANEDLAAWARGKLLDENLPTRSRLFWFGAGMPDGRFVMLRDLGDDAPAVIFEIGRSEADPRVRQMAWRALIASARNPDYVPLLVDD
jgi:hypothetical protein